MFCTWLVTERDIFWYLETLLLLPSSLFSFFGESEVIVFIWISHYFFSSMTMSCVLYLKAVQATSARFAWHHGRTLYAGMGFICSGLVFSKGLFAALRWEGESFSSAIHCCKTSSWFMVNKSNYSLIHNSSIYCIYCIDWFLWPNFYSLTVVSLTMHA